MKRLAPRLLRERLLLPQYLAPRLTPRPFHDTPSRRIAPTPPPTASPKLSPPHPPLPNPPRPPPPPQPPPPLPPTAPTPPPPRPHRRALPAAQQRRPLQHRKRPRRLLCLGAAAHLIPSPAHRSPAGRHKRLRRAQGP